MTEWRALRLPPGCGAATAGSNSAHLGRFDVEDEKTDDGYGVVTWVHGLPIYRQVMNQIHRQIMTGQLATGEPLDPAEQKPWIGVYRYDIIIMS